MGNHDCWLSWRWAWAFLMTASVASALSLSDFQIIAPATVPPGCILAYNTRIPGCVLRDFDFKRGNICSAECVSGLNRVQYIVQMACSDVTVGPSPLLGQVVMGNLVGVLCPGVSSPGATTSSSSTSPTTKPTIATAITRASSRALTSPTVRSSSTTSTIETQTEDPDTFSSISSTSVNTAIPTIAQSPTSTITAKSSTSSSPPRPTPNGGSVGNPFEIVFSDSRRLLASWTRTTFVALGIGLLLLR